MATRLVLFSIISVDKSDRSHRPRAPTRYSGFRQTSKPFSRFGFRMRDPLIYPVLPVEPVPPSTCLRSYRSRTRCIVHWARALTRSWKWKLDLLVLLMTFRFLGYLASSYIRRRKSRFQKLETEFIGVFSGKFSPVGPNSPSNKINKIPSRRKAERSKASSSGERSFWSILRMARHVWSVWKRAEAHNIGHESHRD